MRNVRKLEKEKSETFHGLIAKMLFDTKRALTDTGIAISYLTTIVIDPDKINWMKMVYLFKYVRGTKYLPLILSAYNIVMLKWYIFGYHAVHPNVMVHTGGGLTMGKGF